MANAKIGSQRRREGLEILTFADKGGRGELENADNADKFFVFSWYFLVIQGEGDKAYAGKTNIAKRGGLAYADFG